MAARGEAEAAVQEVEGPLAKRLRKDVREEMVLMRQDVLNDMTGLLQKFGEEQAVQFSAFGHNLVLRIGTHISNVIMHPTGVFIKAMRAAIKLPAKKNTASEENYPSAQRASEYDVCVCSESAGGLPEI